MRFETSQHMKLGQQMKLSPRMIQSMEILQLPMMALEERIEQELIENPVLEAREPDGPETASEVESSDAPTTEEKELVVGEKENNEEDFERLLEMDREFPDHFNDAPRRSASGLAEAGERKLDAMANIAARTFTLQDHLHQQLGELELTDELQLMAERIISCLDSNGYLTGSLEDVLPPMSDPAAVKLAEQALRIVQQLDPPGIGARDLRECLLLQLSPKSPMHVEVRTLISNHLEDLHHNRLPAIQKATGYSLEQIHAIWEHLRKLNPKPGAEFTDIATTSRSISRPSEISAMTSAASAGRSEIAPLTAPRP